MFDKITTNYNGGDATAEIIVMLLVAFVLGFILRWLWEKVFYKEEYEEFIIEDHLRPNQEIKNKKKTVSKIRQKPEDLIIIEGIVFHAPPSFSKSLPSTYTLVARSTTSANLGPVESTDLY